MASPDAVLTFDAEMIGGLLAQLRSVPLRFTSASGVPTELALGAVLDGGYVPECAIAIDVPVPTELRHAAWDRGAAPTLWAAPARASFHLRVVDACSDVLLVGLAGTLSCIVIASARRRRIDVFPDRPDLSAIAIEEMSEREREEFIEYTEATATRIVPGRNVWVPAGSFVFVEWLERGAVLAVRHRRSAAAPETEPSDLSAPYTMREARGRLEDRWNSADRVRLTHGVPLYAHGVDARVRVMLVQSAVVVIDQSFAESSLSFRILDTLFARKNAQASVRELGALAPEAELSRELGELRRDGWISRITAAH